MILLLGMVPARLASGLDDSGNNNGFELDGTITALPTAPDFIGDWTVAGKTIHVTATTKIEQDNGKVAVGAVVEVKGAPQTDGSINASKIEVKLSSGGGSETRLTGSVESIPSTPNRLGDWKIAGKTVHVTATTRLKQENTPIAVGVNVQVEGLLQSDGSINALSIEPKSGSGSNDSRFIGKIEELPSTTGRIGDWKVSGRVVHVAQATKIIQDDGTVAIGVTVKVEGLTLADGSLNATQIEVKSPAGENEDNHIEFRGTVETLPGTTGQIGDWKVSGLTVHVTATTKIKQEFGPVAVKSIVEVEGNRQTDKSVNASEIEVENAVTAPVSNNPGYCRFYGKINSLPSTPGFIGEWNVGGHKLNVVAATTIIQDKGLVAVGALVEVLAVLKSGVLEAVRIEVKQANGNSAGFLKFFGTITALPAAQNFVGDWTVAGKTVHVTATTRINQEKGKVAVNAVVSVVGNQRADGSVDATEIEVKNENNAPTGTTGFISFFGTISSAPTTAGFIGDWVVGTKTIHVTATTKIEQERATVAPGALVEIKGNLRSDGSIDATKIEVKAASSTGGAVATFIEIVGTIKALPATVNLVGDWTVDTRTVRVTATTFIKRESSAVAVGGLVEVKGQLQADGSIDATVIEVKRTAYYASFAPVASVSAGNYQGDNSPESIIASFGSNLAQSTQAATKLPLPTSLGGVSVLVDGKPAGLFFVSPTQINYLVPTGVAVGSAQVAIVNNNKVVAQGSLALPGVSPSLFTADSSGQGVPAGQVLRVTANQELSYEALGRYDSAQQKYVPAPVIRKTGDQLFLVLFGTGFRNAPDTDGNTGNGAAESVQATIGGVNAPVLYVGAAPGFAGLDQINIQLPADAVAGSNVTVTIKVSDGQGNLLRANTVTIAIQ